MNDRNQIEEWKLRKKFILSTPAGESILEEMFHFIEEQAKLMQDLEVFVDENSKKMIELNLFLQKKDTTKNLGMHVINAAMTYTEELEKQNKRYRDLFGKILNSEIDNAEEYANFVDHIAEKALKEDSE